VYPAHPPSVVAGQPAPVADPCQRVHQQQSTPQRSSRGQVAAGPLHAPPTVVPRRVGSRTPSPTPPCPAASQAAIGHATLPLLLGRQRECSVRLRAVHVASALPRPRDVGLSSSCHLVPAPPPTHVADLLLTART